MERHMVYYPTGSLELIQKGFTDRLKVYYPTGSLESLASYT